MTCLFYNKCFYFSYCISIIINWNVHFYNYATSLIWKISPTEREKYLSQDLLFNSCFYYLFILMVLVFELRALPLLSRHSTTWATLSVLFCVGYFVHRFSWTIYPGWPWTIVSRSLPPKYLVLQAWVNGIWSTALNFNIFNSFSNIYNFIIRSPFRNSLFWIILYHVLPVVTILCNNMLLLFPLFGCDFLNQFSSL
jgi:hypothetical protein